MDNEQYLRKCSLLVVGAGDALDLSALRVTFETKQEDEESPNNAQVRVYNLAPETMTRIQKEYTRVILQAGYDGNFGVIFDGTIKQFRIGKEDSTTTYMDLLAADGDRAYNWATVSKSLAAGSTPAQRISALVGAMAPQGVTPGQIIIPENTGGVLPRGRVLFGLARNALRDQVRSTGSTWSIQNGQVNVIPLDGYLPGEAVVLNARTGLIGRAEQTQEGVRARSLINPRIVQGGLVKIDNASINQTVQQKDFAIPGAQLPYNQYAGIQQFADVTADGLYRVYVAEFKGDTRGLPWWEDLILLAVDPSTQKVKPYG